MSNAVFTPDQIDFLSSFFGPGNILRWDAFVNGSMQNATRELLEPLIDDLRREDASVILPRVTESALPRIIWYGMARNAPQSRAFREQLLAFVGPAYTDFSGQNAVLDLDDPVESAVHNRFAPYVFRLEVINSSDREQVRNKIFLMRSMQDRRVDRTAELVRPVGRLLRDLEMAIVVHDEDTVWRCLDNIRARGKLSTQNLAFLKVRILAAFRRWQDIVNLPEFQSLVTIRRPLRITQALVHAVYQVHFAQFEEQTDVDTCVARFHALEATFGTLFRTRGPLDDPLTLKAFLLRAVSTDTPRSEAINEIFQAFPESCSDRAWLEALANSVKFPAEVSETRSPIDEAHAACEAGEFDRAFELLLQGEPSVEVVRQILVCSAEIDSLSAIRRTAAYVDNCPPGLLDSALSMKVYRRIWEGFQESLAPNEPAITVEHFPTNWSEWLERLCSSHEFPGAIEIIRRGVIEWSIDELLASPKQIARIADLLAAARSATADVILRDAIPTMVEAFCPEGQSFRQFKSIYLNLALILALDSSIGASDLAAIALLAETSLEAGLQNSPETNEYQDLLEIIETAWSQVASIRHLDWALSVLDVLIAFNVGQCAMIDPFFNQIASGLRQWSRRVRSDQWDYAEQLASDLDQFTVVAELRPKDEPAAIAPALGEALARKTIAIYTLTERIGHRAAQLLKNRFPELQIQLLQDKVASDRLKQLARTADIFVVNTWDAKHAATGAIKAVRPKNKVTLLPKSKSAGSIVREVYESVSQGASYDA